MLVERWVMEQEKLGIQCKKLMVKEIKDRLAGCPHLFLTSFKGISVTQQDELRSRLRENQTALLVVKNRLAQYVFAESKLEELRPLFQGLMAIILAGDDSLVVSKTLANFASKNEGFKILGAYVDEQLLDAASIKRLASIPSKEALLAQIVGGCKWPIQGLVNSLSGVVKKFVLVIDKIREQKK